MLRVKEPDIFANEPDIFAAIERYILSKDKTELLDLLDSSKNVDLTKKNESGKTPIQFAHTKGCYDIVKLIAEKRDTNEQDEAHYGEALVSSVYYKYYDVASALLKAGAPLTVYYIGEEKNCCLHWAITYKDKKMLELLLKYKDNIHYKNKDNIHYKNKDNIHYKNKDKQTPIQLAATIGYWEGVEMLAQHITPSEETKASLTDILFSAIAKHDPTKCNNISVIKSLIKAGADLTAKNQEDETPIQVAMLKNLWDCVEVIATTKSFDPESPDDARYGDALRRAVMEKKYNVITALLKAGASTNRFVSEEKENCALHEAILSNNAELALLLLTHGADLSRKNKDGLTPMALAAVQGHWACVEAIAKKYPTDTKDTRLYGNAYIHAVMSERLETVEILNKAKAPIDWFTSEARNTCLHVAVTKNNVSMIKLLLKQGANALSLNKDEQTPLELACALGKWESADALIGDESFKIKDKKRAGIAFIHAVSDGKLIIAKSLMTAGASTTERIKPNNYTALHMAVQKNNVLAVKFLLENNASQTDLDDKNKTPIEYAASIGQWDALQALVENYADSQEKASISAMHYSEALLYAIKDGNYTIVEMLLKHETPCQFYDSEKGNIPLYWAVSKNKPDIVRLLLSYGANPNTRNHSSETTLDIAKRLQCSECVAVLESWKKKDDITNLAKTNAAIFRSITDNSVTADDLPETLLKLSASQDALLAADKDRLEHLRSTLESEEKSTENISFLILTINLLLQRRAVPINTNRLLLLAREYAEAKHVLAHITQNEQIDAYVARVRALLEKDKKDISTHSWKRKIFFGAVVDLKPTNIKKIESALNTITPYSSAQAVLKVYAQVLNAYSSMSASETRHPTTTEFYNRKKIEYTNMIFEAPAQVSTEVATSAVAADVRSTYGLLMPQLTSSNVKAPTLSLYPTIDECEKPDGHGVSVPTSGAPSAARQPTMIRNTSVAQTPLPLLPTQSSNALFSSVCNSDSDDLYAQLMALPPPRESTPNITKAESKSTLIPVPA